jgi:hypothetical protein
MRDLGRLLVLGGVIMVCLGVLLTFAGGSGIGRLPGDILYRRGHFTFYFPLMTSVLLSIILSLIFWLFRR